MQQHDIYPKLWEEVPGTEPRFDDDPTWSIHWNGNTWWEASKQQGLWRASTPAKSVALCRWACMAYIMANAGGVSLSEGNDGRVIVWDKDESTIPKKWRGPDLDANLATAVRAVAAATKGDGRE